MRVDLIQHERGFNGLREEWTELLSQCPTRNIFQTWEWCRAWWEVFGTERSLYILTGRDTAGRLAAIAPFQISRTTYYGLRVRKLGFLGHGHSDRMDIIHRQGVGEIRSEMLGHLAADDRAWDVAVFDQVPNDLLSAAARAVDGISVAVESSSRCPYVRLDTEWEAYLKTRSRKFRGDMKNKYNRLARRGSWKMRVHPPSVDAKAVLDVMCRVETESSKSTAQRFLTPLNIQFMERFFDLAGPQGWIDFSCLVLCDDVVAYLLGFRYDGTYMAYNMAYRAPYYECSPGKVLLHEKIRWCMERRDETREFDFLRGGTYIKALWTDDERQHVRLVLFRNSLALRGMRFLVFIARPLVKRFMRGRPALDCRQADRQEEDDART